MSKDKKRVTKSIDGEMYYIPDYVRFLYKNLDERNKEIERLNNIIKIKTDFIQELLEMIYESNDNTLHTKCHLTGVEYEDKLKEY